MVTTLSKLLFQEKLGCNLLNFLYLMMMNLICSHDSAEPHAPAPPALSGFSAASAVEPLPAVATALGGGS